MTADTKGPIVIYADADADAGADADADADADKVVEVRLDGDQQTVWLDPGANG